MFGRFTDGTYFLIALFSRFVQRNCLRFVSRIERRSKRKRERSRRTQRQILIISEERAEEIGGFRGVSVGRRGRARREVQSDDFRQTKGVGTLRSLYVQFGSEQFLDAAVIGYGKLQKIKKSTIRKNTADSRGFQKPLRSPLRQERLL